MKREISIHFAGDVLTRPLAKLHGLLPDFALTIAHRDIDQVHQLLAGPAEGDVVILHMGMDNILEEASAAEAEARMEAYGAALREFAARTAALVIVNTLETVPDAVLGMDRLDGLALAARLNERLFAAARERPNVSVVDIGGIIARLGAERGLSLQNRLVMRMPYTKPAIEAVTAAYAQAIRERYLPRKKVVAVDADNTLWGGVVGEDGADGVAVDRQYPGSVFRRFQTQLLELRRSGLLLALVTRNNPVDIEEVFALRQMPLALSDFSSVRVNWAPKSENLIAVAEELNLGLESIVFIDDNPFELEEVRAALPMVETWRFEAGKADAALGLLGSIPGLKAWSSTAEDLAKADQYAQERERSEAKAAAGGLDAYLDSLDIRLQIGRNRAAQVKRLAQLTNKTNQFNLTTRRYSEADIARFMHGADVFDIRLTDRFGDMGVIGVVIVADGEIDTFLMSCRALGRGVEGQILRHVIDRIGAPALRARYLPTRRNSLTETFFDDNGFDLLDMNREGAKSYRLAGGPPPGRDIPVEEVD